MKSVPDFCDEYPDKIQILQINFKNFGAVDKFCGEIVTVECPEDNSLLRRLLGEDGTGKVLVVNGGASSACAYLGDTLALLACQNNWAGILINGMVRGVDELAKMQIGIKALGAHPKKSEKRGLGEFGRDIEFGGVKFQSGAFVYSDNNGVIVSSSQLL